MESSKTRFIFVKVVTGVAAIMGFAWWLGLFSVPQLALMLHQTAEVKGGVGGLTKKVFNTASLGAVEDVSQKKPPPSAADQAERPVELPSYREPFRQHHF